MIDCLYESCCVYVYLLSTGFCKYLTLILFQSSLSPHPNKRIHLILFITMYIWIHVAKCLCRLIWVFILISFNVQPTILMDFFHFFSVFSDYLLWCVDLNFFYTYFVTSSGSCWTIIHFTKDGLLSQHNKWNTRIKWFWACYKRTL